MVWFFFFFCCELLLSGHAQRCSDDLSWDSNWGHCSAYEEEDNYQYCDHDRGFDGRLASVACPETCGRCSQLSDDVGTASPEPSSTYSPTQEESECEDSTSWNAGWGGCETYYLGGDGHQYCDEDEDAGVFAEDACPRACGKCGSTSSTQECVDSTTWDAGWGGCQDYRDGQDSHEYCSQDTSGGVLARDACPVACGACGTGTVSSPLATDTHSPQTATSIDVSYERVQINTLVYRNEISLPSIGDVYIEYEPKAKISPSHITLRSPTSYGADTHDIYLFRLIADTKYDYYIFVNGEQTIEDSFQTGSLPSRISGRSVSFGDGQGDASVEMFVSARQSVPYWHIYDKHGATVWFWEQNEGDMSVDGGFFVKNNHNILFTVDGGGFIEFSPTGETIYNGNNGCLILHHSISACLFDGEETIWSIGMTRHRVSGLSVDQAVDALVVTNQITGRQDVELDLIDYFDPAEYRSPSADREYDPSELFNCPPESLDGPVNDWAHINHIDVSDDKSFVLMTSRNLGLLWAFSRTSRGWDFEWQLGGKNGSDFRFPNQNDQFYGQHSAKILPNGNVLVFDNGKGRPSREGGDYSRALELELDMSAMTASSVWEFAIEEDGVECLAEHRGSVDRLSNGHTLVVAPLCVNTDEEIGHIFEVDESGRILTHIIQPLDGDRFLIDTLAINSIGGESEVLV